MKKLIIVLITLVISTCFISPVMASEKAADFLKSKVVTSGDGLYEDSTESGRYVFRGANPNNFIKLGDDLYRIISIESDGTLKVMSQNGIDRNDHAWDDRGARYSLDSNDYCNSSDGCNAWGSNTTTLDSNGNHVAQITVDNQQYNLPDKEASLNAYLNGEWYESLDKNVQNLIVNHEWNIGNVTSGEKALSESVQEESAYKWNGKVALINVTDFVKAAISNNGDCNSVKDYGGSTCVNNSQNYLSSKDYMGFGYVFLTPYIFSYSNVLNTTDVKAYGDTGISAPSFARITNFDVNGNSIYNYSSYPVFFLKSDITLSGSGSSSDPFTVSLYKDETIQDSQESTEQPSQVVEVPSTSAYASLIIGAVGIICIIVAIVVMYFTSRKKKVKD